MFHAPPISAGGTPQPPRVPYLHTDCRPLPPSHPAQPPPLSHLNDAAMSCSGSAPSTRISPSSML